MTTTNEQIYRYAELSQTSQDIVKDSYLTSDIHLDNFTTFQIEELEGLFPNSHFKCQWSLSGCQGDGVNVFGKLHKTDALSMEGLEKGLTSDDLRLLTHYLSSWDGTYIEIPENPTRHSYCVANDIDLFELTRSLELKGICQADDDVLGKFEHFLKIWFTKFCEEAEGFGYRYFGEVDDSVINDFCESRELRFYEDGSECYDF